jgi:hypothetical protein
LLFPSSSSVRLHVTEIALPFPVVSREGFTPRIQVMSSCKFPYHWYSQSQLNLCPAKPDQNISDLWIQHQRKNTKTTPNWACIYCPGRRIFASEPALWEHAKADHSEQREARNGDLEAFREEYAAESCQKRYIHCFHLPNPSYLLRKLISLPDRQRIHENRL